MTKIVSSSLTPWYLVTIPDVPALELRQGHVPVVDVVEDGGDLHLLPPSSVCFEFVLKTVFVIGPL